jgi:multiple sugar transport system substrate-binding protein
MKIFRNSLLSGALLTFISMGSTQAAELHYIECGDKLWPSSVKGIEEFKSTNPDIRVVTEAVPWENCQDKVINLAATGRPASIAYVGSRTLKQLANADLIVPIDISAEQQAAYQPGVLDTVAFGRKFWGMPRAFSTKAMFINVGMLKAAGLSGAAPTTWDELYNMAKTVHDKLGVAGIGLAGRNFDNTMHQWLNYLYTNGGSVIDNDTNIITLNSSNAVETLAFYGKLKDVAQEDPLAWERSQLIELFNDEKIAMHINGPWMRNQIKDGIDWVVAQLPVGPRGQAGTLMMTDSLAVFKGTGHEDLAIELGRILTTDDNQYELDTTWGLTPIYQYPLLEQLVKDDPYFEVFINGIPAGNVEPLFTDYKGLKDTLISMIHGMLLNEGPAEDLVAEAAEALEEFK